VEGYLQRGDTVECNFTISGGNERANFTIKNPYGLVDDGMFAEGSYPHLHNYTAKHSGRHIFVFEDSENVTKFVRADFSSPLQPPYYLLGVLIVFGSIVFLFFGMCSLWSYYRYGSKELESAKINPAKLGFSELLISNKYIGIVNDKAVVPLLGRFLGRFRYWMFCILFGIILYIVG
jgi:hypothetical protein